MVILGRTFLGGGNLWWKRVLAAADRLSESTILVTEHEMRETTGIVRAPHMPWCFNIGESQLTSLHCSISFMHSDTIDSNIDSLFKHTFGIKFFFHKGQGQAASLCTCFFQIPHAYLSLLYS